MVPHFQFYVVCLLRSTSDRVASIFSCDRIRTLQGWILTQTFDVEGAECGLGKVGTFHIGTYKTSPGKYRVLKDRTLQTRTFEVGTVNDSIGEIGLFEIRVCNKTKREGK